LPTPYDARQYPQCIGEVLRYPQDAEKRAEALAHLIAERHPFEAFCSSVRGLEDRSSSKAAIVPLHLDKRDLCV
jgi:hypothetical protein